jgi:uncharacterized repeat protein (TIGR01451 family)
MERMLPRFVAIITLLVFCLAPSPSVPPTVAQADTDEWTQHAHDPQRTGYSPDDISRPWRYKWQWNGADESGQGVADWVPMRILVQPITGGGRVYVVAGWVGGEADRVYALAKSDGSVLWSVAPGGELWATPAYSGEALFVPSDNHRLYKLDAQNGSTVTSFLADSPLKTPPLLVGNRVYFTSDSGTLYAVSTDTMSQVWAYAAGAQAATMPAYSASRGLLIFCDRELYVHAVTTDGGQAWRVKPTDRQPYYGDFAGDLGANQASFDYGWPVVADNRGIVFVRLRLDWNTTWSGPGPGGSYPTTNAAIRQFLESHPDQQALFALNLDDGSRAFTPAVGNSAPEAHGSQLTMGSQPAVRRLSNGKEVTYIIWRNGQVSPGSDGRWDSTMGEMVLDGSTVSGYQAGDLRFVSTQFIPTDESNLVSAAGNFVFHSHWLVMCSSDLGDRSGGDSYSNAIGEIGPYVIWDQAGGMGCDFNATTRWCSSLYTENDTRSFGAGFYILYDEPMRYWDSPDPYAFNYAPYVVVSDGMIIIKSIDGAIFVLEYEPEQEPEDDPDLSLSIKRASAVAPRQGEAVTYDIILRNNGGPLTATTTVTDIIPSGLSYIPGSVTATLGTPRYVGGAICWSDILSTTPTMTLTYGVTVTAATPALIQNTAVIDSGPFGTLTRSTAIIVNNGYPIYLPDILKGYRTS